VAPARAKAASVRAKFVRGARSPIPAAALGLGVRSPRGMRALGLGGTSPMMMTRPSYCAARDESSAPRRRLRFRAADPTPIPIPAGRFAASVAWAGSFGADQSEAVQTVTRWVAV